MFVNENIIYHAVDVQFAFNINTSKVWSAILDIKK